MKIMPERIIASKGQNKDRCGKNFKKSENLKI